MSTVVNFKGKKIIEPGVYAQVKSGIPVKPSTFSTGNVCIVDTGSGAKYGGGSGINGVHAVGLGSVYAFKDVNDFKNFIRGGLLFDVADYLFNPENGASGPDTVYLVRAAATTPATIDFTFAGGGPNGGNVSFICLNEGDGGNGYTDETLAKRTVILVGPVAIGNTVLLKVDEGAGPINIMTVVAATTTSPTDLKTLIVNSINAFALGYKAVLQGGDIIITARPRTGATANGWPITAVVVGTPTVTGGAMSGGVDGTITAIGYSAQMMIGVDNPSKFLIEFYEGTYRGKTEGYNDIGGLSASQSAPLLLATSVEFDNIDDLIQWAKNDFIFGKRFVLDSNWQIIGSGLVDAADLTTYSSLNLADGGTTVYGALDLDRTLEDIRELDNTFFLCDRWGDNAQSAQNLKVLDHIKNVAEMDKFMIVGGGIDETKFEDGITNSSISTAKFYDDESVFVVHSGHKQPLIVGSGFEKLNSFYHTANVLGRLGGLDPQTPLTFKSLKIKNFNHILGLKERERALQAGVIHNRLVPGIGNVVNQAINTLQRNTQLINPDGTSFEISVMRIAAQLNKELVLNIRPLFVGNSAGSASPADIKSFVEAYLFSRTVTSQVDNLILSSKNVKVRLIEDYYDITYGFVPNGPINKLFVTGFMLDNNASA